jgi:hypothetical protein
VRWPPDNARRYWIGCETHANIFVKSRGLFVEVRTLTIGALMCVALRNRLIGRVIRSAHRRRAGNCGDETCHAVHLHCGATRPQRVGAFTPPVAGSRLNPESRTVVMDCGPTPSKSAVADLDRRYCRTRVNPSSGGAFRNDNGESARNQRRAHCACTSFADCPSCQSAAWRRALPCRANQNDHPRVPHPHEGRFAIVTDVGSGMRWPRCIIRRMTQRGRRSRVVLAPQGWR